MVSRSPAQVKLLCVAWPPPGIYPRYLLVVQMMGPYRHMDATDNEEKEGDVPAGGYNPHADAVSEQEFDLFDDSVI